MALKPARERRGCVRSWFYIKPRSSDIEHSFLIFKATEGAGGGGTLRIVPYTVRQLSFGDIKEENVRGVYDGPFPWENMFGFHLAGMVGHEFFKPYTVTFDFQNMRIFLQQKR